MLYLPSACVFKYIKNNSTYPSRAGAIHFLQFKSNYLFFPIPQGYSLSESSAKFNVRIYKSPNHNELRVKRKNNDDVDSMDGENDEDLTLLTLLNRARITKFLFFSFTLYIYNMLYGLSLSKIILLKMVVILCVLGTQRVKNEKKSHNFTCI